jgi:hypothetical protein
MTIFAQNRHPEDIYYGSDSNSLQYRVRPVPVLPGGWIERLFIRKGDIQADFLATNFSTIHI